MTSTTAWIRPLAEAPAGIPAPKEVRGSRCRTSDALFTEWAVALGFPDHFGRNWDAFRDCLRDAVNAEPKAIIVREGGELLADEPERASAVLGLILGELGIDVFGD
ncbi:barstar family protein [Streptomyces sp. NPDC004237]|uniref:barstar family protein n=1 Tax=Streptomyces sp. NPDC004237 TaxID=3154455 RepID=UPI0033B171BB